MSRTVIGDGCADDPEDWCIGVGDMADYCVETNKGRYITKEEALEALKKRKKTALFTRFQTLTEKTKSSVSATVMLKSVTL